MILDGQGYGLKQFTAITLTDIKIVIPFFQVIYNTNRINIFFNSIKTLERLSLVVAQLACCQLPQNNEGILQSPSHLCTSEIKGK